MSDKNPAETYLFTPQPLLGDNPRSKEIDAVLTERVHAAMREELAKKKRASFNLWLGVFAAPLSLIALIVGLFDNISAFFGW